MLSSLMWKYWIINEIRLCCLQTQQRQTPQTKEDLPVDRVLHTEAPITHAGIDYLGPLRLKEAGGLSKDTYSFSSA